MTEKTYKDLKKDVWDAGLCSGCGACIAVCPGEGLFFEAGRTECPASTGTCKEDQDGVPCGVCYAVCPRASGEMGQMLGVYTDALAGRAGFEVPHRQSGGAVTAILANALDEGLIDGVVTVTEDRFTLKPRSAIITSSEALIHEAGSRYSWWVPLLASLKEAVVRRKLQRIAVVGVPCAVQAVQRMRSSDHQLAKPYGRSVRLIVGLFCTESFDYHALVEGVLGEKHRIEPWQVKRLNVAGARASINARDTAGNLGDAIASALSGWADRFRQGAGIVGDQSAALGKDTAKLGAVAVNRIADETGRRPLLAVAVGVGILIGMAARSSRGDSSK